MNTLTDRFKRDLLSLRNQAGLTQQQLADEMGAGVQTVQRIEGSMGSKMYTGKVAFEALEARDAASAPAAVVRVEQVYPWPKSAVAAILDRYHNATEIEWLQEEPENMGAWNFIERHTWRVKDLGYDLRHVARVESGSPATGSKTVHNQE